MEQSYLTRESERVNYAARKTQTRLFIAFICILAVLYILSKDTFDYTDLSPGSIPFYIVILVGLVVVSTVIKLFLARRPALNGKNLILPYGENSKEAVGKIIDAEALEGKVLVEEYIDDYADQKKAHGEKIVLTPTYLLLCGSKVTAIPRDKIYWVCAQVGYKGGPFIVRLLVFTENKIFDRTGVDIEHVQSIADKLYKHIPNVFSEHEPSALSYELEKIFAKNPEEFFSLYESERQKH